jgi:hypothetical protein
MSATARPAESVAMVASDGRVRSYTWSNALKMSGTHTTSIVARKIAAIITQARMSCAPCSALFMLRSRFLNNLSYFALSLHGEPAFARFQRLGLQHRLQRRRPDCQDNSSGNQADDIQAHTSSVSGAWSWRRSVSSRSIFMDGELAIEELVPVSVVCGRRGSCFRKCTLRALSYGSPRLHTDAK